MAPGPSVDQRSAPLATLSLIVVDGDVRRDLPSPEVSDEARCIIALIRTQSDPPLRPTVQHGQCGLPLGPARGQAHAAVYRQAVTVLHQCMTHVTKLRRLSALLE